MQYTQIVYEAAIISYRYQSLSYQTHLAPRDDDLIRSMAEVATGHLRIKYVIKMHEQSVLLQPQNCSRSSGLFTMTEVLSVTHLRLRAGAVAHGVRV